MMTVYSGPERRSFNQQLELDMVELRQNTLQNTRDIRRLAGQVKVITDCLDEFKPLAYALRTREGHKTRLIWRIVEAASTTAVIAICGGLVAILGFAFQAWLKGG